MPRRKIPDNIPLPDNLDSMRDILGRARTARQDDLDYGTGPSLTRTTVITRTSRLAEVTGDEEGLMWWS